MDYVHLSIKKTTAILNDHIDNKGYLDMDKLTYLLSLYQVSDLIALKRALTEIIRKTKSKKWLL